jgi:hypothetical protein
MHARAPSHVRDSALRSLVSARGTPDAMEANHECERDDDPDCNAG